MLDFLDEHGRAQFIEMMEFMNPGTLNCRLCDLLGSGLVGHCLEREPHNGMKEEINDENTMKNESSTNPYNLEETKEECKVSENNLIDQYDEETVLQQIPQEDTKVGDVMIRFKNRNKAADTIVVLQEKKKVITGVMDGQSYIRRLSSTPRIKDPNDV